jgi:hypothetical protein
MSAEKYETNFRFNLARWQRWLLRAVIRNLVRWEPMTRPVPGYTVIVGVPAPLERIALPSLKLIARQDRENLHEVLVVCDRPKAQMPTPIEEELQYAFPTLPMRFFYWSDTQRRVVNWLKFSWVDAWLSWCTGISRARTRHAFLHDLDAMLLRPTILQQQYRAIVDAEAPFVGVRHYCGNGIEPSDGFAVTFELMFDAEMVRRELDPVDLFNRVCRFEGRRVELDIFLHAQTILGQADHVPVDASDLVHPGQLFNQFNELRRRSTYTLPESNNLPLIPYFLYLAGEPAVLSEHREAFEAADGEHVRFLGLQMDASRLSSSHAAWLVEQAKRLEQAFAGGLRPEVAMYLSAIGRYIERRDRTLANQSSPREAAPASS